MKQKIRKNIIVSFYNGKNNSKGRVVAQIDRVDDIIIDIIHMDIEKFRQIERITIGINPMHNLVVHNTTASIEELIDDLKIDQEDLISGCRFELKKMKDKRKKMPLRKLQQELFFYESIDLDFVEKNLLNKN